MEATKIVTYGNDMLRQRASDIEEFNDEIKGLIQRMYLAMVEFKGVGLAGPQIGVSKRIFVYDIGEGPHALINPEMVNRRGEEWGYEACLSIPGLQGEVPRATKVIVTGINENGERVRVSADGFLARVFQHEMDHLDGALFIDRADPETLETVGVNEEEDAEDQDRE